MKIMKKLLLISLLATTYSLSEAQIALTSKIIPEWGTDFYEVRDTTATNINVFGSGANQFWDYSGKFIPADTAYLKIIPSKLSPYSDSFPNAGFALKFMRDSMWAYYKMDSTGIYFVGAIFEKPGFTRAARVIPSEVLMPLNNFTHNSSRSGNSVFHTFMGNLLQKSYTSKTITADGFGTIRTPVATFKDVLRLREEKIKTDSLFMWNDTLQSYMYLQDTTFVEHSLQWIQRHSLYGNFIVMEISLRADSSIKEAKYTLPTRCPLALFKTSDSIICSGKKVFFQRISPLAASFKWAINGVPIDSADFVGREITVPGKYQIVLRAMNEVCADSLVKDLYVRKAPVSSAGKDTAISAGTAITLTASGGNKFLWNTGDSTKSITVTPEISTSYSVLVAENGCGNLAFVTVKVLNAQLPSLTFRQNFYGVNPLQRPNQQLCTDSIFKRLIFKRPSDSLDAIGSCLAQNTKVFDTIPSNRFRLRLSPVTLSFLDFSNPPGHRRIYTGGKGVIERKKLDGTFVPVLVMDDISIMGSFTCGEAHAGRMIGRFVKQPGDLSDEFSGLGNSFFVGIFSNFDTVSRGGFHEYATDIEIVPIRRPFKAQGKLISGLRVPIPFDSTGVTLNFNSFVSQTSSDSTSATVVQYFENVPDIVGDDSTATVFNNEYWEIGSTLDSMDAEVCFTFDSTKLHTRRLEHLSLVFQRNAGGGWELIKVKPTRNGNQICFTTDHFSNWSLAMSKSDAKVSLDTVFVNSTASPDTFFKDYKEGGVIVYSLLDPGKTDTLHSIRYDMNPGGDVPQDVTELLEVFWEFYGEHRNALIVDFDDSTADGFENYGNQRILYRPNSAVDWENLPATRVNNDGKEYLRIKIPNGDTREGQYALGKVSEVQPYFSASVTTDTACAGEGIQFYPSATGGVEPFTYQWAIDKGVQLSPPAPIYMFDTIGVYAYSVTVTDANGAMTVYSDSLRLQCLVGINENNYEKNITVYPNPANGDELKVLILNTENIKPHTLLMFDNTGRQVHRIPLNSNAHKQSFDIDLTNLSSSGIYYLLVKGDAGNYGKRVVRVRK
ncbi:MAG: hypothetical protein A3H98_13145 [Bacteroidetes bacterium RIFCSPLOWO2_02_FULL_36_8]|nr:MAG: hypothetical protein A3H98_13145 [Bacteroidetes bacterium RIFCSPLOWO2_02_FULL_36_8]